MGQKEHLKETVKKISGAGIPVSLFINPSIADIDISKEIVPIWWKSIPDFMPMPPVVV